VVWNAGRIEPVRRYTVTVYRPNPHDSASLPINDICFIRESRNGKYIWLGTDGGGFAWFDKSTGRCKRYQSGFRNHIYASVQHILEEEDGTLWLATNGAAFALRFVSDSIHSLRKYVVEAPDSLRIGKNFFATIYKDKSGTLWFGTWVGCIFLAANVGCLSMPT
jgi:ligand-binding sensor domain-containing protein